MRNPLSDRERWDRNVRWLGEIAQDKIFRTVLALCGCGGIGAVFAQTAMHLGFSNFLLVDPDRVELSNFNRLLGVRGSDVGRYKVEFLEQTLLSFNPRAVVKTFPMAFQEVRNAPGTDAEDGQPGPAASSPLEEAEVLVGALDNNLSRLALQLFAAQSLKPLLDLGSGIVLSPTGTVQEKGAQVRFYVPGGPCLLCQGLKVRGSSETLEQARRGAGYVQDTELSPPSAVTLNTAIASMGLDLLVRYLINPSAHLPRYLYYDELKYRLLQIEARSDPHCPICGQNGIEKIALPKK